MDPIFENTLAGALPVIVLRELPVLLKISIYARPTSERGRKALAHSVEHAMLVP